MNTEAWEQEIINQEITNKINIDVIDCIQVTQKEKLVVQYIFSYKCFCGVSATKHTMYAHLVNVHNLPAGVVQMILNMSPVNQQPPQSNPIKP
jgi:hypothetical protein